MTEFMLLLIMMALLLGVILLWSCRQQGWRESRYQARSAQTICEQQCRQAEEMFAGLPLAQVLQEELKSDILPGKNISAALSPQWPSWRTAALLWALVVVLSGSIYVLSGEYRQTREGIVAMQNDPFMGLTPWQKEDRRLETLMRSLRAKPTDSVLWAELGEQYLLLNAFDNAVQAYERALLLRGENAELLSALATVLYYRDGQRLNAASRALIDRALAQDSHEVSALMLLASEAFFNADYSRAIDLWQTLLDTESPRINRVKLIEAINTARMLQQQAVP